MNKTKSKKSMIIKYVILAVGIILLLWFLLPIFGTSLNYGNITGSIVSLMLIAYGIWFSDINQFLVKSWKSTCGKILEIVLMAIAAVILALVIATSAAMITGASRQAAKGSTVIVLGARIYGNVPSRTMYARCEAAYDFLMDNPESMCIVSGGQGSDEKLSEALAMYGILVEKGIDPERILMEDKSVDTDENLRFSKEIIDREGLNPEVAIATNDYHEYRALSYADDAGLKDAGAIPARTLWWVFPTSVVREMYGILEKWLLK